VAEVADTFGKGFAGHHLIITVRAWLSN